MFYLQVQYQRNNFSVCGLFNISWNFLLGVRKMFKNEVKLKLFLSFCLFVDVWKRSHKFSHFTAI